MYGTLAGALRARKVEFDRSTYTADVEGTIAGPDGQTIRITAIHMRYHLRLPAAQREAADRALEVHPRGCPAHESVKDAIRITWSADIEEV
ncbi:MAG: OsmC family protein [Vicinamibacterales bacterium]|nr:OsmC family protein [Vicinamibacterales bacterium]